MSAAPQAPSGQTRQQAPLRRDQPQNIATAITEVSERASLLVREEIELAKAEVSEKVSKLARGTVVAVAAGVFLVTALFFVLIGLALLIYYLLPVNAFAFFWGFFAMAAILIVLGILAGLIAARAVKKGSPPVPSMAIEEARKIRETVNASGGDGAGPAVPGAGAGAGFGAGAGSSAGAAGSGAAGSGAGPAGAAAGDGL